MTNIAPRVMPAMTVEVAWDTDPLTRPDESTGWTRIDDPEAEARVELRRLTTTRGARMRTGEVETSEAAALFGDPDRNLDPAHSGSAWAPDVKLRRRIRFTAGRIGDETLDAEVGEALQAEDSTDLELDQSYPIFTGFIDRLPPRWATGDSWVEVEAMDLLGMIAGKQLPGSVIEATVLAASPVAYWPCTESTGRLVADIVGNVDLTTNRPIAGGEIAAPFDPRPNIIFKRPDDEDTAGLRARRVGITPPPSTMTIAVALRTTGDYAKPVLIKFGNTLSVTDNISIGLFSQGALFAIANGTEIGAGAAIVQTDNASTYPLDKAPHRLVVTIDGTTGDVEFWWDGNPIAVSAFSSSADFSAVDLDDLVATLNFVDVGWGVGTSSSEVDNAGAVGHVAYWDRVLTDDEIEADYAAFSEAWDGDTTGERLERILDIVGVDDDDRNIPTGTQICGPTALGGNAADYLRRIAATEQALIFVDPPGRITMTAPLADDPTPLDTYAGNPDDGIPYRDVTPDYSPDRLVNIADVTPEGGATITDQDDISVDTYGPATVTIDTLHRSPTAARTLAADLASRFAEPRVVITDLELAGRADQSQHHALGVEVGMPLTVKTSPTGPGGGVDYTAVAIRVEHTFDYQAQDLTTVIGLDEA